MPGYVVVDNIRNVIHNFGHVTSFKAYLEINDNSGTKRALRSELQSSGVSLTDTPHNGRKDAADKMIMVDMLAFALDNPPPATIVLISGDKDFVYALSTLRNRKYKIVLIVPSKGAPIILRSQANTILEWRYDVLNQDVWSNQQLQFQSPPGLTIMSRAQSELFSIGSTTAKPAAEQQQQSTASSKSPELPSSLSPPASMVSLSSTSSSKSPPAASETTINLVNSVTGSFAAAVSPHRPASNSYFSNPVPSSSSSASKSPEVQTNNAYALLASTTTSPDPPTDVDVASQPTTVKASKPALSNLSKLSVPKQQERITNDNDNYESFCFSPRAPGFFDLLVEVLELFRLSGEIQPRRSKVGNEITKRNPLVYHRAGCSSFREYVDLAVKEGIVQIGGEKGLAWISLNENYRDKIFINQ
jgi:hypothetical protein